jgi:hypothetical protein
LPPINENAADVDETAEGLIANQQNAWDAFLDPAAWSNSKKGNRWRPWEEEALAGLGEALALGWDG